MSDLKSFVARIEKLAEEKDTYTQDIKDVYAEAKGSGFDTKIMRTVIRRRKMDRAEKKNLDDLVSAYENELSGVNGNNNA